MIARADVDRLLERAPTPGSPILSVFERGIVGLDATLTALQQGRVWILLYADGFAWRGSECPRCRALFGPGGAALCAYCGERVDPLDDLVGRALERAGERDARPEKVSGEAAERLRHTGGIGAIVRF